MLNTYLFMARPIKETPILYGEDARRFEARIAVKRMTDSFGHSNIFATLSLSLSLSLSQVLTASHTLLEIAGIRARIYGFPWNEPREARLFFIPIRL